VASGELQREYDCYGNFVGFKIGNTDILAESKTWAYSLSKVPAQGELEGNFLSWGKLVGGVDYTLYKKSFDIFWMRSLKSSPTFKSDLTSYFIECN